MTKEEILTAKAAIEAAYAEAINSENAYRTARGNKFLALACPTDGSKKPTESTIGAMLDVDPELTALRTARDFAAAKLDVMKMAFKAQSVSGN